MILYLERYIMKKFLSPKSLFLLTFAVLLLLCSSSVRGECNQERGKNSLSNEVTLSIEEVQEILRRILDLHSKPAKTQDEFGEILRLQQKIHNSVPVERGLSIYEFGDPMAYDGTDKSLVTTIAYGGYHRHFALSPEDLEKFPGLVEATRPRFGCTRDIGIVGIIIPDDYDKDIPYPYRELDEYLEVSKQAYGKNFPNPDKDGTMYYYFIKTYSRNFVLTHVAPWGLPPVPDKSLRPYESWGKKSAYNKKIYRRILPRYEKAKAVLTSYWLKRNYPKEKAEDFAMRGLYHIPFGAFEYK